MIWAQSIPDAVERCTCGARMIMRYSAKFNSSFFGCERYPVCKVTMAIGADGKAIRPTGDPETEAMRARLRQKLKIWFDFKNPTDMEAFGHFLKATVGLIKIKDLNRKQIEILLKKLEA